MQSTAIAVLLLSTAGAVLGTNGGCDANNCARAVTGTREGKTPSVPSRSADCSSFQLTTVIADTITVMVTVTPEPVTTTVSTTGRWVYRRDQQQQQDQPRALGPRAAVTVVPTAIPAYASPCAGASAYKSACSCWGIFESVTTVPGPTTFQTTTLDQATVTATDTAVPTRCAGAVPKGCRSRPQCASSEDRCDCGADVEGNGVCFQSPVHGCDAYPACSRNADCPSGQKCMANGNTCCPGPYCQPEAAAGECPNQAAGAKRALMQAVRGTSRRDGKLMSDLDA